MGGQSYTCCGASYGEVHNAVGRSAYMPMLFVFLYPFTDSREPESEDIDLLESSNVYRK